MPFHLRKLLPCTIGSPFPKILNTNTHGTSSIISPPLSPTSSTSPAQSKQSTAVQQLYQLQKRHSSTSSSNTASSTASSNSSAPEKPKSSSTTQSKAVGQQQQQQELPKMTERATFAAGCFWGVEKAFQKHFKNDNIKTRVGYIGGIDAHPTYKKVCSGITRHAEAVSIEYTPSPTITYPLLVEFFYRMHDPTTLNSQGPDRGTQYRSAIFAHSSDQADIARRVTKEVQEARYGRKKIVTEIVWREGSSNGAGAGGHAWYDAEEYHQKYLDKNPHGYECPSHFLRW
ncbi:Peptide-methionine (S)-S-oxide reductase [Linnemannia schmuckeri]|uniref:peptide-methionine (S)-S-oxide reductase n=1 Tax=Linnemannia schmuckeri TaxID=64567 RepID=A0A9P5V6G0_9FUNG|nr:Peptide-methionine (S)-S-oxide reductase [Linnemannia schmuckeri]